LLSAVVLIGVTFGAVDYFTKLVNPVTLLSGTGLGGTAAHSYNDRNSSATETYSAFLDHPFIGRSLGGVPIYKAARHGIDIHSMSEVRNNWGFPVILDVLVASGIFGIIPFLLFVYANTFGALRTATRYWPCERAKWLRALARAMIFECLLLMVDQNLLRVYVWFHVSMVALVAYNLEFGAAAEPGMVTTGPPANPLLKASDHGRLVETAY
jgi:O-antigen ligase